MKVIIVLLCIAVLYMLYRTYPPFGGKTPEHVKWKSTNFRRGKFVNQIPTKVHVSVSEILSMLTAMLKSSPDRKPKQLPSHGSWESLNTKSIKQPRITWFGHSAFLLEIDGKRVLLDPMLGKFASPFPILGPKRFSGALDVDIAALPDIDAVVISHDHYDHLDYGSIKKLRNKVTMFFVPLGVGAHLEKWGVGTDHITELDWWQDSVLEGITFTCTPARHSSGRTLTDGSATLWASWAITGKQANIYFSGDSGYGPHFKQIGDRLGPFDLTLIECGQYDVRWPEVHMEPEQSLAAHGDLQGVKMIPMHWGAFALSFHDWTEPIERVFEAAKKTHVTILSPLPGEVVAFQIKNNLSRSWWKSD